MIPEDIFFTDFTEVAELEDGRMVAPGLVSGTSVPVLMKSP